MEERTIKVNKDTAISWYHSDNIILKTLALQAFSKEELEIPSIPEMIKIILNSGEYDITTTQRTQLQALRGRSILLISAPKLLRVIALYFNNGWRKTVSNTGYFISKRNWSGYQIRESLDGNWGIVKHETVYYPLTYFKDKKGCEKAFNILKELNKLDSLYTDL